MLSAAIPAATAAAGAAVVAFGVKGIQAFGDLGKKVLDFQRTSGATAQQASALVAAFDDVGISAETGANAMFQLGKRLENSGAALAGFGVTAVKTKNGTTDLAATLMSVADAYKSTADPAQRAALLNAAFGKSGAQLIPILERGSAGIKAMYADAKNTGQILSQDDVKKAEDFRLSMDQLGDSFRQFEIAAGKALVPIAKDFVDLTTKGLEFVDKVLNAKIGGESWVHDLGATLNPLKGFNATSGVSADNLQKITHAADYKGMIVYGKATDDAAKANADLADKSGEASDNLAATTVTADKLKDKVLDLAAAQRSAADAARAVTTAQRDLSEKQKDLSALLTKGAVDEKEVTKARRDLTAAQKEQTQASIDLAKAQEDVKKSEADLAELRSGLAASKAMAEHADDLGKAQLGVVRAQKRLTDAQDNLTNLQVSGTATARELSDAQDDITDATYGLHDAQSNLAATQDNLNKLSMIGAENSPVTIAAIDANKDAHNRLNGALDAVSKATQDVQDKEAALGTALAGDPNFKKEVADARQAVADAQQHVADAIFNSSQKAYDAKGKFDDLNSSMGNNVANAKALNAQLAALKAQFPELAPFLGPALQLIQSGIVGALAQGPPGAQQPKNTLLTPAPQMLHADGGVATRATLGVFGEAGPEALIPLPADWRNGGGIGGGSTTVVLNVTGFMGPGAEDQLATVVQAALKRMQDRGWNLGFNN